MKRAIIAGAMAAVSAVVVPAGIGNADAVLSPGCQAINIGDVDVSFSVVGGSFHPGEFVTLSTSDDDPFVWKLQFCPECVLQ